jgi:hypothetical protein
MITITLTHVGPNAAEFTITGLEIGTRYNFEVHRQPDDALEDVHPDHHTPTADDPDAEVTVFDPQTTTPPAPGLLEFLVLDADNTILVRHEFEVVGPALPPDGGGAKPTVVRLDRAAAIPTTDEVLTRAILRGTRSRLFNQYKAYIDSRLDRKAVLASNAYDNLVQATRDFLASATWGTIVDPQNLFLRDGALPYVANVATRFRDVVQPHGPTTTVSTAQPTSPAPAKRTTKREPPAALTDPAYDCGDPLSDIDTIMTDEPLPVELFWSYWQEEGGLVQSLNLILARFQNRRVGPGPNPLARFDLSPLRPLRHLLWAFAEEEVSRLTIRRRAAEYQFEYGLDLIGRAVPGRKIYTERRSQFLESFHTLLHEAQAFYHVDDDTTVMADAFPVLNALRDNHLVLAEGAENQFGDLPTEARVQMLVMQWLLAQPEMRDFLGGRPMMPYAEPWMDRVDTMKSLYGWSPTSITHFHDLAVHGEELILTIRWGNWNDTTATAASAANWARAMRNQLQRYVHAYRATTGVDLVEGVDTTMPAQLLARRSAAGARRM